jgi:hypothetical protein
MMIVKLSSSSSGLISSSLVALLVLQTETCTAWHRGSTVAFGRPFATRTQSVSVRPEANGGNREKVFPAASIGVVEATNDNSSSDELLALRLSCETSVALISSDVGCFFF